MSIHKIIMSLKEKFNSVNGLQNPKLNKLILDYFKTYCSDNIYYLITDISKGKTKPTSNYILNVSNIIKENTDLKSHRINIYLHTIYKLVEKFDEMGIDCSNFNDSDLFNIICLSKVAYDFGMNTICYKKSIIDHKTAYKICEKDIDDYIYKIASLYNNIPITLMAGTGYNIRNSLKKEGSDLYIYLLTEYVTALDSVIDTSKYTRDDIEKIVEWFDETYNSLTGLNNVHPIIKKFNDSFIEEILSKMKK